MTTDPLIPFLVAGINGHGEVGSGKMVVRKH